MKILHAPGQEALHSYAEEAVRNFDSSGRVIHQGRNIIKVFQTPEGPINVKAYKTPGLLNRLVYTIIRKPKGLRGFLYPQIMAKLGVATPAPVAYIEERKGGLIRRSWLVTRQSALDHRMYEFGDKTVEREADEETVRAFALFTASMHSAGVLHLDYSPGNILFGRDSNGKLAFEVVDVNRMRFGKVSVTEGCRNLARLWGQPKFFSILADEYARSRGADSEACYKEIAEAREKFWRRFSRRHKVKYDYKPLL